MPEQYVMPIKAIRNLLLREYEDKRQTAYSLLRHGTLPDNSRGWDLHDYFLDALYAVKDEILSIETYEQANEFVGSHYRMSLQEWIESL